jgi:hypothetical protein
MRRGRPTTTTSGSPSPSTFAIATWGKWSCAPFQVPARVAERAQVIREDDRLEAGHR